MPIVDKFDDILSLRGEGRSLVAMSKECARGLGMSEERIQDSSDENGVVWIILEN